ncbi:hypothetical protein BSKO_01821 [Bryopsis sp. KO-2023]|nr:hypothetical protein BSKO_01821 [Bryopsis sp. KO-2023]
MVFAFPRPYHLKLCFSNRYVYAQVLNKKTGGIEVSASTIEKGIREALHEQKVSLSDKSACALVGRLIAERSREKDISELHYKTKVGQRYHGKLQVLLDAISAGGLKFT